jgi:pimeloyl-ACP methyl ester carboxylesterase
MPAVVLEQRVCEIGGERIRYRVAGAGPPALLVHGLAGSTRWWEPVVPLLAPHLRLHLVDLPGFGSARRRRFVLGDVPSFLRTLAEHLGLERPHLVGHSLGGAICARFAALWPDALERLVLVAPAGLVERRRVGQYALPLGLAARHLRPAFLSVVMRDSLRAGALTLYRAARQLLADDALAGQLWSIRTPTLLVWGDRDALVPPILARRYLDALPHARLALIPGAGHVPMADRPEAFSRAVLDFLVP